jgi:hypothetical protein
LQDFDVLLMTATEPTLTDGNYASSEEIARAWMLDSKGNDSYFYNNRQAGITTFEDDPILTLLKARA